MTSSFKLWNGNRNSLEVVFKFPDDLGFLSLDPTCLKSKFSLFCPFPCQTNTHIRLVVTFIVLHFCLVWNSVCWVVSQTVYSEMICYFTVLITSADVISGSHFTPSPDTVDVSQTVNYYHFKIWWFKCLEKWEHYRTSAQKDDPTDPEMFWSALWPVTCCLTLVFVSADFLQMMPSCCIGLIVNKSVCKQSRCKLSAHFK